MKNSYSVSQSRSMQAYEDGKQIEFFNGGSTSPWRVTDNPKWTWSHYDYRIKLEPQPETLEDKIKEKWPDREVEMLGICKENGWLGLSEEGGARDPHFYAQSIKGFAGYIYCHEENNWLVSSKPVKSWRNKFVHPVAVLFEVVK